MAEHKNNPPLKGLTGWLVRRFVARPEHLTSEKTRSEYGILAGWVSCLVNLVLWGIKLGLGLATGSAALVVDAWHSAGDMFTSAIVIFGFMVSRKPRDAEHPYGHANAELVASLVMSVLLIIAGFELGKPNLVRLWENENFPPVHADAITLGLVALTLVFKEWLFAFSKALSKVITSKALETDAWHHRLDSFTTVLVILGLVAANLGVAWLDAAMGVVISLVIIYSGVELAKESISPLLGENVSAETIQEIRALTMQEPLIKDVHDILVHTYGHSHYVSLHIELPASLSVTEMHDLAAQVEVRINQRFLGECNVHVDPINLRSPRYQEVREVLEQLVKDRVELVDVHDLHFRREEGKEVIYFEFSVAPHIAEETYQELHRQLQEKLQELWANSDLQFALEPGYNIVQR